MKSWLPVVLMLLCLVSCQGSPARVSTQSSAQVAEDANLASKSNSELCAYIDRKKARTLGVDSYIERKEWRGKWTEALNIELRSRGLPKDYCERADHYNAQIAFEAEWDTEIYNIDLLRVTTQTKRDANYCARGGVHKILLEGQISPDSSFAMSRLLSRLQPCMSSDGRLILPITISLQSGGGLLDDGYSMGRTFREAGVTTVVEDGQGCASSCAVAFLGGGKRIVEDDGIVMYHAPYFSGQNVYGKRDIDCDVGEEALEELSGYYREMTDAETGDRLFERTMWYCSAEDGWVVRGGSAAELFGIATEK